MPPTLTADRGRRSARALPCAVRRDAPADRRAAARRASGACASSPSELDAAQSRLSFHLKVLKDAGLVHDRSQGQWTYYTLCIGDHSARRDARMRNARSVKRDAAAGCLGPVNGCCSHSPLPAIFGRHEHHHARTSKRRSKQKYGEAACAPQSGATSSCCGGSCGCGTDDPITSNLYRRRNGPRFPRRRCSPRSAAATRPRSPSCAPGEIVLDLGSGGGIDVLLSAQARRPDRQGVRPRHDRRDARARQREQGEGRRDERRVPQGRRSRPSRCPTTRST